MPRDTPTPLSLAEVIAELERLGTAQNRKIYLRHGMPPDAVFGVSFAHLKTLQKRIKKDQALAEALWHTGNADARHLAALIADPAAFTDKQLNAWAKDLRYQLEADLLGSIAAKAGNAQGLAERWSASKSEWIGCAGHAAIARLAMSPEERPDAWFLERLALIEARIHGAKNFTRHAMNMALIAIGGRNDALWATARAAAARIGKVEVDHGETGCKTPDAMAYMAKMHAHKRRRASAC
jgi:3-methyladenine DNA glycosylase AlkD